MYIIFR